MTAVTTSHIVLDERGQAYIEGTRTRVVLVVMDQMNGLNPEQIHQTYPYLSLAKVHAALAYYYDHKAELDDQIVREVQEVDQLRAQAIASGKQPTRAELEKRLKERGKHSVSLRLYMDHHVRAEITAGLRARGVDVMTAFEDGSSQADDPIVLERATQLGRILFSPDRDLLVHTANWIHVGRRFSGLVYGHQLRVTIGQCVEGLEIICGVHDPPEVENTIIYLPL